MIAILRYNAGNVQSVSNALHRLGVEPLITDDPTELHAADKVIFPGVGEANTAMAYLKERGLDEVFTSLQQPVLGICLGLQLMCKHSEENDTECLGIFEQEVKQFTKSDLKVPQIGWNETFGLKTSLFKGIDEHSDFYFVHSYYAELSAHTISTTDYGINFSSALHQDNFYAVQFHPEKSGAIGQQLLQNFLEL